MAKSVGKVELSETGLTLDITLQNYNPGYKAIVGETYHSDLIKFLDGK